MMSKNLKDYVKIYDNFLDTEMCAKIVEKLQEYEWEPHYYLSDNNSKIYHNENLSFLNGATFEEHYILNKKLWNIINQYILVDFKSFKWFSRWEGYTFAKYHRYNTESFMRNHCDHVQSIFDGKRKGIPTLTIIGGLNNTYSGGEIVMWEEDIYELKAGQVMVFPSNFLYPHKINRIKEGIRYSFVSWVW